MNQTTVTTYLGGNFTTSTFGISSTSFGLQQNNSETFTGHLYWNNTVHYTLIVLYVLVTLIGITSNGFVCYLFAIKQLKHSSFNLLLVNVSIADILVAVFSYPYIFMVMADNNNFSANGANVACGLIQGQTLYSLPTVVNYNTLTFISINRFAAIRYPFRAACIKNKKCSLWFISLIWPISAVLITPHLFLHVYNRTHQACFRRAVHESINIPVYVLFTTVTGFVLPLIIMIVTFFSTVRYLWFEGVNRNQRQTIKRKRIIILLGTLLLAFFACFTPNFVQYSFNLYGKGIKGYIQQTRVLRITMLIALCNTICDPLLYAIFSKELRVAIASVIQRRRSEANVTDDVNRRTASKEVSV